MKQNKKYLVLSAAALMLLVALTAAVVRLVSGDADEEAASDSVSGMMAYETNLITDDSDALQDAVDKLYEKAKEGQMALEMQTEAISADGTTFQCYLANSRSNNYDMFMVFYDDETQEEIYRSGLIPIGSRIEEFKLKEELGPGSHAITVVFHQVEADRQTVHAQVNVGLTLIVR